MRPQTYFYLFAVIFPKSITAYEISLFPSLQFRSQRLASLVVRPGDGCKTDHTGVASSAMLKSEDTSAGVFYVVFFEGNDCNPDKIIARGNDGCVKALYGSFEVWNVCEGDKTDCLN
ncbi:hypothetical protein BDV95DRAFT_595463 [Massariosphaeria phaeospora]|uniref:Uncharacterized protein n=1 Tax=Massariosphaeria phaeospora TaxID=100035 RepID=A0A7C8IDZ9_9PLEO|nr:hypothetical protein BDV95DRAFT_595463 [Massariosphaeria phaeospora]